MYIKVKVTPEAKKEILIKLKDDLFIVSVKEKAERNLANRRVRELLTNYFCLPSGRVRLVSGYHSGSKIFSVG